MTESENALETMLVWTLPVLLICLQTVHVSASGPIDSGITVTAVNTFNGWTPDKAVDGDATRAPNVCSCCASSGFVYEPWYKADLGKVYNIRRVVVLGRGGPNDGSYSHGPKGYDHTLKNMRATYGVASHSEHVMFSNTPDTFTYNYTLSTPQPGRYLELTLVDRTQFFVICELYVFAECADGTYGSTCSGRCGHCLNGLPCNKDTGVCQSCASGYKGDNCDQECTDGTYGSTCSGRCGHCLNGLPCNKDTGVCQSCASGYKGDNCDQECDSGNYGLDCAERCGRCKIGDHSCNKFNGSCSECQQGFLEPLCNACSRGKYGPDCNSTCGFCLEGNACDPETGECSRGCSDGYKGPLCKTICSPGTFGKNCESLCGNCSNGDVCKYDNGHCERGCDPGLKPPTCIEGLPVSEKDRTGQLLAFAIGGTIGSILVLGAFILTIIVFVSRRFQEKSPDPTDNLEMRTRAVYVIEPLYDQNQGQQIAESFNVDVVLETDTKYQNLDQSIADSIYINASLETDHPHDQNQDQQIAESYYLNVSSEADAKYQNLDQNIAESFRVNTRLETVYTDDQDQSIAESDYVDVSSETDSKYQNLDQNIAESFYVNAGLEAEHPHDQNQHQQIDDCDYVKVD